MNEVIVDLGNGVEVKAVVEQAMLDGSYLASWGRIAGIAADTESQAIKNLKTAIVQTVHMIRDTDLINRL